MNAFSCHWSLSKFTSSFPSLCTLPTCSLTLRLLTLTTLCVDLHQDSSGPPDCPFSLSEGFPLPGLPSPSCISSCLPGVIFCFRERCPLARCCHGLGGLSRLEDPLRMGFQANNYSITPCSPASMVAGSSRSGFFLVSQHPHSNFKIQLLSLVLAILL